MRFKVTRRRLREETVTVHAFTQADAANKARLRRDADWLPTVAADTDWSYLIEPMR